MSFSLPRLLSKIQSIITLDTANNNLVLANSLVFPDGTKQTTAGVAVDAFARNTANGANGLAQGAYDKANSSYNQANTATGIAQAAFDSANNVFPQIQPAWNTANTAYDNTLYLQGINNTQNTSISIIQSVNEWQNTQITAVNNYAGAAFNTANNVNDHIALLEGVDLTQNSQITAVNQYATSAYNTANTGAANIVILQGVDATQNTRLTDVEYLAQYARDTANNAVANTNILVGVDNTQNTRINSIETNNNIQNVAIGVIQGTNLTQNTRLDGIEGTNLTQNTNIISVNQYAASAYAQANVTIGVDATQNSIISIIQGVDETQNTRLTSVEFVAQYARDTANNAVANTNLIAGVNITQNTRLNGIEGTNATQNTRIDSIETINTNQNTSISIIQGVDLTQNTRLDGIEGTNTTQNTRIGSIETINTNQNTSISIIQSVDLTQNTRLDGIEGVNLTQNTNITAVNQFAQSAYNKANSNTFIDITVTGNVTANSINTAEFFATANAYVRGSRVLTGDDLATSTHLPVYITMDPTQVTVPVVGTSTTYGAYNFGSVTDIQTYGDYNVAANTGFYSVNDAVGAPGHVEYIGFTGITDFNRLVLNVNYTQQSGHTQDIDLYNYDTNSWDTFGTYSGSGNWQNFTLGLIDSVPYISATGNVTVRNYHVSSGNVQHRTWIDYVAIEKSITGGQGPRGATGATGATGPTGPIDYSAANTAQAAYNAANTKLSLTGGTITGSLLISQDLNVTGNLFIGGNTTSVSANNITLNDSLIYLADGNPANTSDIGLVGHFVEGKYQHTGVVRNHLNGNWTFFSNVSTEPTTTVNFAEANLVYDSITTGGIITPTANIGGKDYQSVNDTQNTNITTANNAAWASFVTANSAQANTIYTQGVDRAQNTAIGVIQGVNLSTNNAISIIQGVDLGQNAAISIIQGVDTTQNTRLDSIEGINLVQNTSISVIQGTNDTQNTRINSIETINSNQNTTISIIQGVDATQNTRLDGIEGTNLTQNTNITAVNNYAASAYGTANTNATNIAYVNQYAASAYSAGNTNATNITAVNNYATSAYNQANVTAGGLTTANSNISIIQGVDAWQNNQITYVNQFAAAAYNKANTGVSSANGFITVNSNSSLINATSNTDILTIMPGNNISFVTDTVNKKITISTSITAVTIPTFALSRSSFVAASAQTSVAIAHTVPYVYVSVNGITVDPSEYTANGTHIVLTTPLRIGDVVDITGYTSGTSTVQAIKGDKGDVGSFTSNTALYATDLYSTGNVTTTNDVRSAGGSVSLNDTYNNVVFLQSINNTQNTNITAVNQFAQSSYNVANSASANTIVTQGVDATQNAAISVIQGVNLWQNTQITAVNQFAQSAYNTANTKFNSSGGNITGDVTISGNNSLTVTGNLTITGTTFTSCTATFVTNDPVLFLGIGNYVNDINDIGFIAHYNDGANAHTGLIRDAGTKEYYFFKGYTPEADANNDININHASFQTANVYAAYHKGNVIGSSVNTANIYISTSVGVGTPASGIVGEIRAANNILSYYTSDKQFKENIVDIPNALDKVDAIGGKLFDWTDSYLNNHGGVDEYYVRKNDFGVIAQDVQAVFPVAVRSKPDGSLAVDYEKLSALAFAAIKELKKEIDELKGKK